MHDGHCMNTCCMSACMPGVQACPCVCVFFFGGGKWGGDGRTWVTFRLHFKEICFILLTYSFGIKWLRKLHFLSLIHRELSACSSSSTTIKYDLLYIFCKDTERIHNAYHVKSGKTHFAYLHVSLYCLKSCFASFIAEHCKSVFIIWKSGGSVRVHAQNCCVVSKCPTLDSAWTILMLMPKLFYAQNSSLMYWWIVVAHFKEHQRRLWLM